MYKTIRGSPLQFYGYRNIFKIFHILRKSSTKTGAKWRKKFEVFRILGCIFHHRPSEKNAHFPRENQEKRRDLVKNHRKPLKYEFFVNIFRFNPYLRENVDIHSLKVSFFTLSSIDARTF